MTDEPEIEAERRINVLINGLFELAALHRPQQSLCLRETAAMCSLLFGLLLLLLGDEPLVLAQGTIVQSHKALSLLEEILIGLVWSEVYRE